MFSRTGHVTLLNVGNPGPLMHVTESLGETLWTTRTFSRVLLSLQNQLIVVSPGTI